MSHSAVSLNNRQNNQVIRQVAPISSDANCIARIADDALLQSIHSRRHSTRRIIGEIGESDPEKAALFSHYLHSGGGLHQREEIGDEAFGPGLLGGMLEVAAAIVGPVCEKAIEIVFHGNEAEVQKEMASEFVEAKIQMPKGEWVTGRHSGGRIMEGGERLAENYYLKKFHLIAYGKGKFRTDNFRYSGEFSNGLFHDLTGDAVCHYDRETTYYGQFSEGKRAGPGELRKYDGKLRDFYICYKGMWKEDKPYSGDYFSSSGEVIATVENGVRQPTVSVDGEMPGEQMVGVDLLPAEKDGTMDKVSGITEQIQHIIEKLSDNTPIPKIIEASKALFQLLTAFLVENLSPNRDILQKLWKPLQKLEMALDNSSKSIELKFSLIQSFRYILELVIYQFFYYQQQPNHIQVQNRVSNLLDRLYDDLPEEVSVGEEKFVSSIEAKFNLRCSMQITKLLHLNKNIGELLITQLQHKAHIHKICELLQSEAARLGLAQWYPDIWKLNWLSAQITSLNSYRTTIKPNVESYLERGGEFTVGLTIAYMKILENPRADVGLKDEAFRMLGKLINLEHGTRLLDYLDHPEEIVNLIKRNADRFGETRSLARDFLLRLYHSTDDSYREQIRAFFLRRLERVTVNQESRLQEERSYKGKYEKIENEIKEISSEKIPLEDEYNALSEASRSPQVEKREKEVVEALGLIESKEKEKNKEIDRIATAVGYVQLLKKEDGKELEILQGLYQSIQPKSKGETETVSLAEVGRKD